MRTRSLAKGSADRMRCVFGTLPGGEYLGVRRTLAYMSALILGATGAGKTCFLLSILLNSLQQTKGFSHRDRAVEIDLIDPKAETFDLLRKHIAALWLRATPEVRAEIESSVRIIDWSCDRVTPLAPFDNPPGSEISNAYLAHTRADVTVRSSAHAYTDSMRQLLYMWNWLLVEAPVSPELSLCRALHARGSIPPRSSFAGQRARGPLLL